MNVSIRLNRARTLLAAPALALVLAACGGTENPVATDASLEVPAAAPSVPQAEAEPPTEAVPTLDAEPAESAESTEAAEPAEAAESTEAAEPAEATEAPAPDEEPGRPAVEQLSAELAIANADVNIANLAAPASDATVLDVEVLAVGDGSIQTLRDVVDGDRPVLLWFYAPH